MSVFQVLLGVIAFCYALACWNSFHYYRNLDEGADNLATRFAGMGLALQGVFLSWKWVQEGYLPFTSLDGILLALSFSLSAALLIGRFKTPVGILASLFLPFICFLSVGSFGVGLNPTPLMDSRLMTSGMASHIFLTFLGFSHFTLGFGVAVAFWIQEGQLKQHRIKSWSYRLPALEILDGLTVFYIGLGYLFWSLGLVLGAVQALQVWNRFPLDDPKILGALLVLVIFTFFFLLRWGLRMRGKKTMMLVMAGYFLALFTFVGVRVFLTTRHVF